MGPTLRYMRLAGDPKGFDKPEGTDDRERHRTIPGMNPGVVVLEGNEVEVKVPSQLSKFSMVFKATCNNCDGVQTTKEYWITIYPSLSQQ